MAKRKRSVKTVNQRIAINTLGGGVGRQAPSKRLPSEAETIENCYVTLERSISKRSGFEIFRNNEGGFQYDLNIDDIESKDLWFHWFDVASNARYLIMIDFNATSSSQQFLWIFRLMALGWKDISPANNSIGPELRRYLTHRNDEYSTAREALRCISVGQALIILNRTVKTGFSSQDSGPGWPFGSGSAPIAGLEEAAFRYVLGLHAADPNTSYNAQNVSSEGSGLAVKMNYAGTKVTEVTSPGDGYKLDDVVKFNNNTFRLTNPANYMFDLDGNLMNNIDLKGRPITYYTTVEQDPLAEATEWTPLNAYITGDFVIGGSPRQVYKVINTIADGTDEIETTNYLAVRDGKLIEVEDWAYPDNDFKYKGQSLDNFGSIKFPPLKTDISANNGSTDTVFSDGRGISRTAETLRALYPNTGDKADNGDATGMGKVYFTAGAYLAAMPGYYRIISKNAEEGGSGRPFTQKVRTPEGHCMFDSNRMPVRLSLVNSNNFEFEPIEWDPRTNGTLKTNPGPAIFTKDDESLRQIEINSIAFYRGRLFFSAADTLFSSRIGDFDNFWFEDAGNIVASDPIDLQASSNKYSRINAMIPFSDYLFINTDSDAQFELLGSENTITPFTAELAPTAFYSTAPLVDPVLMGSQIYFFADKKMYIYFSTQTGSIASALEVSSHCPDYLPSEFGSTAVAGSRDTIFFVDEDNKNEIFVYSNRYSGDRVIQNAFHKWVLNSEDQVLSLTHFDDKLYAVIQKPRGDGTTILYLERIAMSYEEYTKPRIDHRYKHITADENTEYLPETDQTRIVVPFLAPNINEVILDDGWGELKYLRITPDSVVTYVDSKQTWVTIQGNYKTIDNKFYLGESFLMNVELSQQFFRDENNNIINGILSLKSMSIRHSYTGNYRLEVKRRGRAALVTTFDVNQLGVRGQTLGSLELFEPEGEMTAKILGFGSETQIFIKSDFPTPVNISNMEIKAMFRPTYSSVLD